MRQFPILFCLAFAGIANAQSCEATATIRDVLERLEVPDDAHEPAAVRREHKLNALRTALSASPADVMLHEAYQDLRLGGMDANRAALIEEYEKLLASHPQDPLYLYLAANAQAGQKTQEAIANLERAIERAPEFGLPHLLLARIYSARNYAKPAEAKAHFARFAELCPASVRTLSALRWSKDTELIKCEALRLRRNLEARTDSEAVAAYPALWGLEAALERSDQQAENQARLRRDIDRLLCPEFARNSAWLGTMQATNYIEGAPEGAGAKARSELASRYPNSDAALSEEYAKATAGFKYPQNGTAEQVEAYWRQIWRASLPLMRKWPASLWLAASAARAVAEDRSAGPEQVREVIGLYREALRQDPDSFRTLPPQPIETAQRLVDRGGPFDQVPELVFDAFARIGREAAVNDLTWAAGAALAKERDTWSVMAFLPLAEADVQLGRISSAKDMLAQTEAALHRIRPPEGASSEERVRFAELVVPYWFIRAMTAEKEGRKADALIDYRNALSLYPPRRERPDRRNEIMAAAERVWKDLGGTAQGWTDWASQSSLSGFYAGSGGSGAWSKLAESSPDLVLTDALDNRWNPKELAKKTSFITLWASWCGPCRAELPYLEKLYRRFRERNDIAILAFNVDDDPKAMMAALKELKVSIPSIAARDFAYSIVPTMALPANWIITPDKTEMFLSEDRSLEQWYENAAAAIESAAKR